MANRKCDNCGESIDMKFFPESARRAVGTMGSPP